MVTHAGRFVSCCAALLVVLSGCSSETGPTSRVAVGPAFNVKPPGSGLDVCKVGPAGTTATFTVSATGGQVLVSSPFTIPARPQGTGCFDAASANGGPVNDVLVWTPDPNGDPNQTAAVTVTETGASAGAQLVQINAETNAGEQNVYPPANSITLNLSSANGGGTVILINGPTTGLCTDAAATNFGGPLPCVYPPPVCTDQNASNYGGPLPCVYPGKTFSIGPSSMEGHLKITAGTWFNGGYSFKFKSATHAATTFTVTSRVEVPVTCPYGGGPGGTILIPLGTVAYNVPAGNTNWLPTGDQNSILSWMGAVHTPDLCGGFPMDNARGGVFTATVSQSPATGSLVDFRFKYRNPAAKGKVDTNCTDASEPKRNDAATCGASWSQTVTDP